jgi:hypothetical protein
VQIFILFCLKVSAQKKDSVNNQFSIDIEFRPRLEFRSNNIQPPIDTLSPYLFGTQRNRITLNYSKNNKINFKSELQEIHEWDTNKTYSRVGSINFYQLYFEYITKRVKLKVGRQGVLLDNGRIFSDAPWAQQSRAHEGIKLTEFSKRHTQDLFFLFTRDYGNIFHTTYSPVSSHRYKFLSVYHLKTSFKNGISLNTINYLEFFENKNISNKSILRATMGGRFEYQNKNIYTTVNGFVQFGQNAQGKNISAYYLQPEIKFLIKKNTVRLGAEIISGTPISFRMNQSGSFDIRYGVAWKFMGNMNLFTRFPEDLADRGLVNPYLFLIIPVNQRCIIRSDFHAFFSQYSLKKSVGNSKNKYLGYENDLSLKYSLNKSVEINSGISYTLSSPLMSELPKIVDAGKIALWGYLMVSYSISALK